MFAKILRSVFGSDASNEASRANPFATEGAIYVTLEEDGSFHALKVLKTDEFGVHLRLYSNTFAQAPESIDESALYLAGIGRNTNERLGMGHVPVSNESFAAWRAQFVQQSTVSPDELDGYETWKEAGGGYF
jgi:hypothetical protein